MDEFGVLTERYGLKPQGKSAPMSAIKRAPVATAVTSQSINVSSNPNSWSSNSAVGGLGDHLDSLFVGSGKSNGGGGSSFGYDSIFSSGGKTSSTSSANYDDDDDDIFGLNQSTARSNGGVPTKFPAPPPPPAGRSSPVGDLLGGYHENDDDIFGGIGKSRPLNGNATAKAQRNSAQTEELIPGFGSGTSFSNRYINPRQSTAKSTIFYDPLSVFESSSKPRSTSGLVSDPLMEEFGQFSSAGTAKDNSVKDATASTIDELEKFAMAKASKSVDDQLKFPSVVKKPPNKPQTKSGYDFESSIGMGSRSSSILKSRTTSVTNKEVPGTSQSPPMRTSSGIKKASSSVNIVDDLADMFGDASIFGEFTEVEGESEERRRARLGRQTRTRQRMAQALAEKNERDYQTQQEQEEKSRVAENLEADIKRWAAGKEGNMRALLSSLQYVLWPECGWESVSLTDLITSTSVKKVYRKATLCVHPDKVQQKGATIQQKYTAEKVFDILKEAYKKFETDELR